MYAPGEFNKRTLREAAKKAREGSRGGSLNSPKFENVLQLFRKGRAVRGNGKLRGEHHHIRAKATSVLSSEANRPQTLKVHNKTPAQGGEADEKGTDRVKITPQTKIEKTPKKNQQGHRSKSSLPPAKKN